jgi:urea transport system substrate-binding protein
MRKMALIISLAVGMMLVGCDSNENKQPIKVGVLHSLTGTMAQSEQPLKQVIEMAVDELNQQGGLLNRRIELVVVDTASDNKKAAQGAQALIEQHQVDAMFGCWTSGCRKAVKPIVEKHQNLLFYPLQYEGLESSPNIFYLGAAPNQQIIPGARWGFETFGRRIYLIGSNYVFPRIANLLIKDLIRTGDGVLLGEHYLALGQQDVSQVIQEIAELKPDLILNTLNGDSNQFLFAEMRKAGLQDTPMISFSVAEPELQAWKGGELTQHYGVWGFFQSLNDEQSRRFVAKYQQRYGKHQPVSDPMISAYLGFQLWARAVDFVQSTQPQEVNSAYLHNLSMPAPGFAVAVDRKNRHLWRPIRIGHVQPNGQYREVWSSYHLVRPTPWPDYRSRFAWDKYLRAEGVMP